MPPRTSQRKRAAPATVKVEEKAIQKPSPKKKTTAASKKRKAAEESEINEDHECDSHNEDAKEEEPTPKKRKTTKKDKEDDMAPLAARTAVSSLKKAMYIGAHVSGAGGKSSPIL